MTYYIIILKYIPYSSAVQKSRFSAKDALFGLLFLGIWNINSSIFEPGIPRL
jgi:hypothetical protein